jgi:glutaminyl-peptide cyclotransferase
MNNHFNENPHRTQKWIYAALAICFFTNVFAYTNKNPQQELQQGTHFSQENIDFFLKQFTQKPHPMGSSQQLKLAKEYQKTLNSLGIFTKLEYFSAQTPPIFSPSNSLQQTEGINVIGEIKGKAHCALIFAGHYDTKYFPDEKFIGANDGGSSTAFLLELARVLKEREALPKNMRSPRKFCSYYFVLFDGEEAMLPNWNDGRDRYGIEDHLYGSRYFVAHNIDSKTKQIEKNKIKFTVIFDMIGHKNQTLFLTEGSDFRYGNHLIKASQSTLIQHEPIFIEDDHIPFYQINIPFLHIIDWTNTQEWHKIEDNLSIVSSKKIMNFGEDFIEFLESPIKR